MLVLVALLPSVSFADLRLITADANGQPWPCSATAFAATADLGIVGINTCTDPTTFNPLQLSIPVLADLTARTFLSLPQPWKDLPNYQGTRGMGMSRDGRWVTMMSWRRNDRLFSNRIVGLHAYDVVTDRLETIATIDPGVGTTNLQPAGVSNDGHVFFTSNASGLIASDDNLDATWHLYEWSPNHTLIRYRSTDFGIPDVSITSVVVSATGRFLALGGWPQPLSGPIRVELQTKTSVPLCASLPGFRSGETCGALAISDDGQRVVLASESSTGSRALLQDLTTGTYTSLGGPGEAGCSDLPVVGAGFSADGNSVALLLSDGGVWTQPSVIFDVAAGFCQSPIQDEAGRPLGTATGPALLGTGASRAVFSMFPANSKGQSQVYLWSPPADADSDGLPDVWERLAGLNPVGNGPDEGALGDADGDGVNNAAELVRGTHPRGVHHARLGHLGFVTPSSTLAIFNPSATTRRVLTTTGLGDGVREWHEMAPWSRLVVTTQNDLPQDVLVEADGIVAVDRIYGTGAVAADSGVPAPATEWWFAEGVAAAFLNPVFRLVNPSPTPLVVEATRIVDDGREITPVTYHVGVFSSTQVYLTDFRPSPEAYGTVWRSVSGQPFLVTRQMGGHWSSPLAAPVLRSFMAEGATQDYFDAYLLLVNPSDSWASVLVSCLREGDTPVEIGQAIPPRSRINVRLRDVTGLDHAAFAIEVASVNGVPVLAERAMWWPLGGLPPGYWIDSHVSSPSTTTAATWAVADGLVDPVPAIPADRWQTYVLVGNFGDRAEQLDVTLFCDGKAPSVRVMTVAARSRLTIDVEHAFGVTSACGFAALVSARAGDARLVVERASYRGEFPVWFGGASLATPLQQE